MNDKPEFTSDISFNDYDSELVMAFHEKVQQSLVYIEHTCLKTGKTVTGSGTVIGYQGNKHDGWLPYIATAGHVIRSESGHESRFRLHRFSFDNPVHPTSRISEFETDLKDSRSPCGIYYSGPHNNVIDVGFLRGPRDCTDGKPFFELDDDKNPIAGTMPIETDWFWATEGTRVAWAGFPGIATQIAERPQPCYFEGCVSALIMHDDWNLYLIDGHNTLGVSGGPVWATRKGSQVTQSPRIIGVVSGYNSLKDNPQLPGFAIVVPIQPLRVFLEKAWGAQPKTSS